MAAACSLAEMAAFERLERDRLGLRGPRGVAGEADDAAVALESQWGAFQPPWSSSESSTKKN